MGAGPVTLADGRVEARPDPRVHAPPAARPLDRVLGHRRARGIAVERRVVDHPSAQPPVAALALAVDLDPAREAVAVSAFTRRPSACFWRFRPDGDVVVRAAAGGLVDAGAPIAGVVDAVRVGVVRWVRVDSHPRHQHAGRGLERRPTEHDAPVRGRQHAGDAAAGPRIVLDPAVGSEARVGVAVLESLPDDELASEAPGHDQPVVGGGRERADRVLGNALEVTDTAKVEGRVQLAGRGEAHERRAGAEGAPDGVLARCVREHHWPIAGVDGEVEDVVVRALIREQVELGVAVAGEARVRGPVALEAEHGHVLAERQQHARGARHDDPRLTVDDDVLRVVGEAVVDDLLPVVSERGVQAPVLAQPDEEEVLVVEVGAELLAVDVPAEQDAAVRLDGDRG